MGDGEGWRQPLAKERMIWSWSGEAHADDLRRNGKVDCKGRTLSVQPVFTDSNVFAPKGAPIQVVRIQNRFLFYR
jgi:hypothetical protein